MFADVFRKYGTPLCQDQRHIISLEWNKTKNLDNQDQKNISVKIYIFEKDKNVDGIV